jgi:hypothetical protein
MTETNNALTVKTIETQIKEAQDTYLLSVPVYSKTKELDKYKSSAKNKYSVGHRSLKEAIAEGFLWYSLSKHNEDYLNKEFEDYGQVKGVIPHYNLTAIHCFGLDVATQYPSITKYARNMHFIQLHFDPSIIEPDNLKPSIDAIVDILEQCEKHGVEGKGLGAIAKHTSELLSGKTQKKKEKSKTSNESPDEDSDLEGLAAELSPEEISDKITDYQERERGNWGNFSATEKVKDIELTESKMVVMLGSVRGPSIEIVELVVNDEILEKIIQLQRQ